MVFAYCPQHSDEQVDGVWANEDDGWSFTCDRSGHVLPRKLTLDTAAGAAGGVALTGVERSSAWRSNCLPR